jgi:glycosyltransferase involved in cell wall biosynthesis
MSRVRRILFFGSLVDPPVVRSLPEASEAANRYQLGLLQGLLGAGVERVVAVTALPVAARRAGRGGGTSSYRWNPLPGLEIVAPSYLNVAPVKPFAVHARLRGVGLHAAEIRPDAVLCYNPVPGSASAGLAVARKLRVPFVTIAADFAMPSTMPGLRAAQARWSLRILRASDGMIVLSGHIVGDIGFGGPWIKVDGGVTDDWDELPPVAPVATAVGYAGTPAEVSGTRLLLAAFRLIPDEEARLMVSGRGGLEEEVRTAALADPRIRFVGFLDRSELQRLLRAATVLVNPRESRFPENRYNFPAKLLDYLASGRPTITTLAGDLDPEYRRVTFPLVEETPEALATLIHALLEKPERDLAAIGTAGREFVLATRRWKNQATRVLEFVESIEANRS